MDKHDFNLGDPVLIVRAGIPVRGHVWGRTGATVDHGQRYDVRTQNGMATYLTAEDLKRDQSGKRVEATR
jgi:hypothetical protein